MHNSSQPEATFKEVGAEDDMGGKLGAYRDQRRHELTHALKLGNLAKFINMLPKRHLTAQHSVMGWCTETYSRGFVGVCKGGNTRGGARSLPGREEGSMSERGVRGWGCLCVGFPANFTSFGYQL